jgi:hypothetical protein
MTACARYREALVEIARGRGEDAGARRHAAACGSCAELLFEQHALTAALRAVAEHDEALQPSPALEARLRAAVRARAPRRLPRRPLLASLAAAVLLAMGLVAASLRRDTPVPAPRAAAVEDDAAEEFAPLVYGEPLEGADALHLTRVRVPRSALSSFGWRGPVDDGPPVDAEVLVGQDGVARGIRFVSGDGGAFR